MNKFSERFFYSFYKRLFSVGLRSYYREIAIQGEENIPENGPIMTVSNHPTGLMDVFLAGHRIKRQIKFTAAGSLFKDKLQAAFLRSAGALPLYRRKDSAGEMDKNKSSFEECFKELESRGAIGFYPEGTSHPEPWVNPIKTGAARVALQVENRNDFNLNLKIIPIGINSLKPGAFRGFAFVNIGKPITIKRYKELYKKDSSAAVEKLTAEIQQMMQSCTYHITDDSLINFAEDIKIIGFDDLNFKNHNVKGKAAKLFYITKLIDNVNSLGEKAKKLGEQMKKLGIQGKTKPNLMQFLLLLLVAIIVLPVAIPSFIVNFLPFLLSKKVGRMLAGKDHTLIPAARLMMGTVIFLIYYLILTIIVANFIGPGKAFLATISLLIGGYITLWYGDALKALRLSWRKILLWITRKGVMQQLTTTRDEIIRELEILLHKRA